MNTLHNIVYTVSDLAAAKTIHTTLLGVEPHTDTPYYVGYNVNGTEFALAPQSGGASIGPTPHFGVTDINAALEELKAAGAAVVDEPRDVGAGTLVAAVTDADGIRLGVIQGPAA